MKNLGLKYYKNERGSVLVITLLVTLMLLILTVLNQHVLTE